LPTSDVSALRGITLGVVVFVPLGCASPNAVRIDLAITLTSIRCEVTYDKQQSRG